MKAAVSRSFGPPDVVTVADVPRPEPRGDEILVRVRAAAVGVVDGLARRGSPWYARAHFGLPRPRFPVLGCDFAGQLEAAGPAVSRSAWARRYSARSRPGSAPRRVHLPAGARRGGAEAGQCELRRGDRAGRRDGAVLPAGQGWSAGRAGGPGQRGVRGGRLRRGAAGRALRRHRDRGLQRASYEARAQAGRGIRRRLHPDGFHPRRTPLRRDLRRGRHELVRPLPPGAQPRRHVPDHRPLPRDLRADAVDGEVRLPAGRWSRSPGCGRLRRSRGTCWSSGNSPRRRRWFPWSARATRWPRSPTRTGASARATRKAPLS